MMTRNAASSLYLDNNATTPVDPAVSAVMSPLLQRAYGNPHSEHAPGWDAAGLIDEAQAHAANLIGASPDEIVFTSGATEANNHAIQGVLRRISGRKAHLITTAIEHKSVLQTCMAMHCDDVELQILPVGKDGRIDPDRVAAALKDETVLVSVGMANNEIGAVQPVREIAALCRDRGVTFHTDAAQAIGKIPVNVIADGIDLLSLSGHKLYGPKGIGALYVSRHAPVKPSPLIFGGAQQNGMRAGTVPTFLCVGLGEACHIAGQRLQADSEHAAHLRAMLISTLQASIPDLELNGTMEHRLAGNLNIHIPGVDAEALLSALQGKIAASTGSACNAGLIEPSHVLRAIGLSSEAIASSIRIGIGRMTTEADIQTAAALIADKATSLRRIPIYS